MNDGRNVKCPRCWHWHTVPKNFDHLCDGCQKTIMEHFPTHPSTPHIRSALEVQRKKYTVAAP